MSIKDRFMNEDFTAGTYDFVVVYLSELPSTVVGVVKWRDETCACVVSYDTIDAKRTRRETVFNLKYIINYCVARKA